MNCFLYCVTTERQSFPVKIGKTSPRNIKGRLTALQTGLPWRLRILLVIECDATFEREFHRACADEHLRGEWFVPTIGLLDTIEGVADEFPDWVHFVPKPFDKYVGKAIR